MSVPEAAAAHPGRSVGPTSEFSLFFHVKPGEGAAIGLFDPRVMIVSRP